MATDNVQTSAGTIVSVSAGIPATFDAAGFAAKTYTVVGQVDNAGELGSSITPVTFTPLSTAVEDSYHGVKTLGDTTVTAALVGGDAGQLLVQAAYDDKTLVSVKYELFDGDVIYFIAIVLSRPIQVNGPDQVVMTSFNFRRKPMGATGIDKVYVEAV